MPVLRVSFDIYNLDDARDLHRYTGHLVEFYKKIETPEEAPNKVRLSAQRKSLPLRNRLKRRSKMRHHPQTTNSSIP
jgi:hypothetical protein